MIGVLSAILVGLPQTFIERDEDGKTKSRRTGIYKNAGAGARRRYASGHRRGRTGESEISRRERRADSWPTVANTTHAGVRS